MFVFVAMSSAFPLVPQQIPSGGCPAKLALAMAQSFPFSDPSDLPWMLPSHFPSQFMKTTPLSILRLEKSKNCTSFTAVKHTL